ncbi:cell division protein ZapA [Bacillus xiapuensis]|uniref:cell division protein ZapA n=1 Tax=Bacillus xiapuensis TaxID=2014075 RepID=UPI000C237CC8|nr:cell division protein ZapA [Bacillus xiapuensis]
MSDKEKTRITVEIHGHHYTIVGTESKSHIRMVAKLVDDKMREISVKNPVLDLNKIAVLTAVNAVHEYVKLQEEMEQLKKQLNQIKD